MHSKSIGIVFFCKMHNTFKLNCFDKYFLCFRVSRLKTFSTFVIQRLFNDLFEKFKSQIYTPSIALLQDCLIPPTRISLRKLKLNPLFVMLEKVRFIFRKIVICQDKF